MRKTITRILAVALAVFMMTGFFACKKSDEGTTKATETTTKPISSSNPLTGADDLNPAYIGKRPIAIVVENSPAARPQWGLGSADITVEGLVEGGITRMLWLYADASSAPKVGPVRSARIDFVEVAEGFDAIFTHFGGAESAYGVIDSRKVDDIDGNGRGNLPSCPQYFKRDTSRNSRGTEHTAYTTGEWLTNALKNTGVRTDTKTGYTVPFSFNAKDVAGTNACAELGFTFSSSYKHTFKYNSTDGKYYNYMNTSEMKDENGNQMSVKNVIILYFPSYSMITGTKGSIDMDLSGGKGIVASCGKYTEITWKKGGPSDSIKLYDANGKDFSLNKGKSYIGLVPAKNTSLTTIK